MVCRRYHLIRTQEGRLDVTEEPVFRIHVIYITGIPCSVGVSECVVTTPGCIYYVSFCMTLSPCVSLGGFLSVLLVGKTSKMEGGVSHSETAAATARPPPPQIVQNFLQARTIQALAL